VVLGAERAPDLDEAGEDLLGRLPGVHRELADEQARGISTYAEVRPKPACAGCAGSTCRRQQLVQRGGVHDAGCGG
jgi:hypothetical protein